jgi:hypothetical protein
MNGCVGGGGVGLFPFFLFTHFRTFWMKRKCADCLATSPPIDIVYASFGASGLVCRACKVARDSTAFLNDPLQYKWNDCNEQGKPFFVQRVGHFYDLSRKYKASVLIGDIITKDPRLEALMAFAETENKNYGGFYSPVELIRTRLERAVPLETLDFWLTLSIAFDTFNYFPQFVKHNK